jgi:hypothetical protein
MCVNILLYKTFSINISTKNIDDSLISLATLALIKGTFS